MVDTFLTNKTLREASGSLTAADITDDILVAKFNHAEVIINVTTLTVGDADDEVDFYIQTSYNGEDNWVDLVNLHLSNADSSTTGSWVLTLHKAMSNKGPVAVTDGNLADNTSSDLSMGNTIRIKTKVTGATAPTYAYNAQAHLSI